MLFIKPLVYVTPTIDTEPFYIHLSINTMCPTQERDIKFYYVILLYLFYMSLFLKLFLKECILIDLNFKVLVN